MTDQDLLHSQTAVDDCWNRIGVFGDKRCPQLERHIHCRNCEVYSAAAIALLDRYGTQLEPDSNAYGQAEANAELGEQRSLLIFRLGEEWLALATYHRATGRGLPSEAYALNLISGLCLMLALRSALQSEPWYWGAGCLAASGLAHLTYLRRRWRRQRQADQAFLA